MTELSFLVFSAIFILPAALMLFVDEPVYCSALLLVSAGGAGGIFIILNSGYLAFLTILAPVLLIPGLLSKNQEPNVDRFNRKKLFSRLKNGTAIFIFIVFLLSYILLGHPAPVGLPGEFAIDLIGGDYINFIAQLFFEEYIIIPPLLGLIFVVLYLGMTLLSEGEEN